MAAFWSTYTNKVDKKGRVSIPAAFRPHLVCKAFQGVVVFPAFRGAALECRNWDQMDEMTRTISGLPEFSPEREVLSAALFGAATPLPFDPEGRILLPKHLIEYAGIDHEAAFVGKGDSLQNWEPSALAKFMADARAQVAARGLSLPPRGGVGMPTSPMGGMMSGMGGAGSGFGGAGFGVSPSSDEESGQ